MRAINTLFFLALAACGGGQIHNLPLEWRGVDGRPAASLEVAQAFAAVPFSFALRDARPDPSAVGTYEDDGFVVRTADNVGAYCTQKLGDLLTRSGARLNEPPRASVETELLEYKVVEGGTFHGVVRLRMIVHGAQGDWAKIYEGTSKRWGRTHNPENFNEALSNALEEAATHLVKDKDFADVLIAVASGQPTPVPTQGPGGVAGGPAGG
ncbi:MAG TPA: hypothetical protein VGM39_10680 [Kofleriaceae bacterium]|jgi:uncharacterized lipoprotein YajG